MYVKIFTKRSLLVLSALGIRLLRQLKKKACRRHLEVGVEKNIRKKFAGAVGAGTEKAWNF
jgi:hypothetical protein